jgi:hypothetical protein
LAADNQSGVVSSAISSIVLATDSRPARFVRTRYGRACAPAAPFGDLSRGGHFPVVDLFVRHGDHERAGSSQPHRGRHPHNQHHSIGRLDQFDCGSQRSL